ncbi:hypothetical protein GJ496_007450, partial [Pomphorhynchus laevis]
ILEYTLLSFEQLTPECKGLPKYHSFNYYSSYNQLQGITRIFITASGVLTHDQILAIGDETGNVFVMLYEEGFLQKHRCLNVNEDKSDLNAVTIIQFDSYNDHIIMAVGQGKKQFTFKIWNWLKDEILIKHNEYNPIYNVCLLSIKPMTYIVNTESEASLYTRINFDSEDITCTIPVCYRFNDKLPEISALTRLSPEIVSVQNKTF